MNKVDCQIVNILLNDNNEFTNKYTSFVNGSFDEDSILNDYYIEKGMNSIKIDFTNQSICFSNPNEKISIYNSSSRKNEYYYEEVHIHCNDLYHFDNFVNYLNSSEFTVHEVDSIPHYDIIKNNLKNSELVMFPMTNEVSNTRSLVTLLNQRSDETVFRALVIYFCKLVNNVSEIDSDLIRKLNTIYQDNVVSNENLFFASSIANKLININNTDKKYNTRISNLPSQNIDLQNEDYSIEL